MKSYSSAEESAFNFQVAEEGTSITASRTVVSRARSKQD